METKFLLKQALTTLSLLLALDGLQQKRHGSVASLTAKCNAGTTYHVLSLQLKCNANSESAQYTIFSRDNAALCNAAI